MGLHILLAQGRTADSGVSACPLAARSAFLLWCLVIVCCAALFEFFDLFFVTVFPLGDLVGSAGALCFLLVGFAAITPSGLAVSVLAVRRCLSHGNEPQRRVSFLRRPSQRRAGGR